MPATKNGALVQLDVEPSKLVSLNAFLQALMKGAVRAVLDQLEDGRASGLAGQPLEKSLEARERRIRPDEGRAQRTELMLPAPQDREREAVEPWDSLENEHAVEALTGVNEERFDRRVCAERTPARQHHPCFLEDVRFERGAGEVVPRGDVRLEGVRAGGDDDGRGHVAAAATIAAACLMRGDYLRVTRTLPTRQTDAWPSAGR